MTALFHSFSVLFCLQTLADNHGLFYGEKRPAKRGKRFNGAEHEPTIGVSIMPLNPHRADSAFNQSEIDDLSPIQPIYSDDPALVGDLVQTALKRAVMAAWEHGAITNLEAWWIIQREGLQHK